MREGHRLPCCFWVWRCLDLAGSQAPPPHPHPPAPQYPVWGTAWVILPRTPCPVSAYCHFLGGGGGVAGPLRQQTCGGSAFSPRTAERAEGQLWKLPCDVPLGGPERGTLPPCTEVWPLDVDGPFCSPFVPFVCGLTVMMRHGAASQPWDKTAERRTGQLPVPSSALSACRRVLLRDGGQGSEVPAPATSQEFFGALSSTQSWCGAGPGWGCRSWP